MRVYRHVTANDLRLEPFPFRRELSMEAYLIENEEVLSLDDDQYSSVEVVASELRLREGRQSRQTDGRIDVLATYSQECIAVVELKLGQLEMLHLQQLEDYLLTKEKILKSYPDIFNKELAAAPKWIGVVIGTSIASGLAEKLRQGYVTGKGVPIAGLTIQRFRATDGTVLVTTDTYFNYPNASKDISKYRFDGNVLGKSRLVLAVLKRHVETHQGLTFSKLLNDFPKHCQGSLGVFAALDVANEIYTRTGRKRHFVDADEIIQLSDGVIAVCNQWGAGNIKHFLARVKELGYEISATDA